MVKPNIILLISAVFILAQNINCSIDVSNIDINTLNANITEQLANVNITAAADDAKKLIEEKCKKISGDEKAFQNIQEGAQKLIECMTNIINVTKIQEEIEVARPNGQLDEVFNKYCKKRPEAIACFDVFETTLQPCLDDEEKTHYEVLMRVLKSILNFVCYKGGDQIALFIAEKGPECFESNKDPLTTCFNETFGNYFPKDGFESLDTIPKFVMGPKQCDELKQFEQCTVKVLEKCEEITPANIVESMFRFIKNETVCATGPKSSSQSGNSGTNISSVFGLIILCLIYLMFNK